MAAFKDLLQDNTGDLLISNGDLNIGFSDGQHLADIIYSAPNWWKEYPFLGVNIQAFLSSGTDSPQLNTKVLTQLRSDGFTVNSANFTKDNNNNFVLDTDATRL